MYLVRRLVSANSEIVYYSNSLEEAGKKLLLVYVRKSLKRVIKVSMRPLQYLQASGRGNRPLTEPLGITQTMGCGWVD